MNLSPFEECVNTLGAYSLTIHEEKIITKIFRTMYPMTTWGKVDWDKIDKKIFVENNHEKILPALQKLLPPNFDKTVYIDWDSGSNPIIKSNVDKVIEYFYYVRRAAFDKFIFNPKAGYIIEATSWQKITVGIVPIPDEIKHELQSLERVIPYVQS